MGDAQRLAGMLLGAYPGYPQSEVTATWYITELLPYPVEEGEKAIETMVHEREREAPPSAGALFRALRRASEPRRRREAQLAEERGLSAENELSLDEFLRTRGIARQKGESAFDVLVRAAREQRDRVPGYPEVPMDDEEVNPDGRV